MRGLFYALALAILLAPAHAEQLPSADVKAAMITVEATLSSLGVDVSGYAAGEVPPAEFAPSDHPYLQGNDGGYADGRVYINAEGIEACHDLTLIHELVHDATVKHGLFASVPNHRIRAVIEALADAVTAAVAENPYRPGCVPSRPIALSSADLSRLAQADP